MAEAVGVAFEVILIVGIIRLVVEAVKIVVVVIGFIVA